jgi:hypothetical protein
MRLSVLVLSIAGFALAAPALANDSMAELKTGGLNFVRSDVISMMSEDLYVSADEVRVDYVFRNTSDEDVDALVAFPMPEIGGNPWENVSIPFPENDNFLGFSVRADGVDVQPQLEQRALALGVDVTSELRSLGIPLVPASQKAFERLEALDRQTVEDWVARGIVENSRYDAGSGMKDHPSPLWTLQSTYYWRMVFPAGQDIVVHHQYTPSVGGTAGLVFLDWEGNRSEYFDDYVRDYCVDDGFERAVRRRMEEAGRDTMPFWESNISYILTTGKNWFGPIKRFHLTVDKGSTANLVSFCGDGVTKTGPTTFELVYEDFYPQTDLKILLLQSSQ